MESLERMDDLPAQSTEFDEFSLEIAMRSCLSGCTRMKSLRDDEFGVMANCPGQIMRLVNR